LKALRKELDDAQIIAKEGVSMAKVCAKDAHSMILELGQVKEELVQVRSQKQSLGNSAFASEELDILTRNITKIGHRTSQVETLQMELQLLKGRVQRIESRGLPTANFGSMSSFARHEAVCDDEVRRPKLEGLGKRRIYVTTTADNPVLGSSAAIRTAKRPTLADWSSSPPASYASMSSPPSVGNGTVPKRPNTP
jgi:hypothetical protein